ncbi:calmodulin-like protein 7 isoform X2 [Pomacea canaliculata]|uniref:calmodulin-like protein 7 isoform X2 n=1 Tax=Pomacea canaliculata TaxID=400727 RepID=UPI000D73C94D|nr:calmodulin-like protein 7 isoform X2 [Pomacea canaliculata]
MAAMMKVLSVCPPIPCRPPDVTTASHTASGTRSCQPLPALPANTSPRVQDKTHKAYTAMSRLLLVVASVLLACGSWASALPFDGAVPWNLELEPLTSSSYFRMRRQAAFPESLTSCVTITFLTDMKHRFESLIDTNHDGRATAEEMEAYLRKFKPSVTDEEVAAFIRRRDIDGDSVIDFIPEYVLDISSPDMSPEAAREWFMLEDRNGDSYVAKSELLTIAENLGMSPDQAEDSVSSYYMSADANKDEQLSFQEYKSLYGQRR